MTDAGAASICATGTIQREAVSRGLDEMCDEEWAMARRTTLSARLARCASSPTREPAPEAHDASPVGAWPSVRAGTGERGPMAMTPGIRGALGGVNLEA
jgi:hypothetical protein